MTADFAPGSFCDIVRQNNGFLVSPLQWTSRHLELVGCRFEEVATTPSDTKSDQRDNGDGIGRTSHPKAAADAETLAMDIFAIIKRECLIRILVGREKPFARHSKGPSFYFHGGPVHRPRYIVFHSNANGTPPPIPVGYVHYTDVNGDRRRQFEPCPGPNGTLNWIGGAICNKRLAQTSPQDWTEDPYFVCHLLALAQHQDRTLNLTKPTTYTSRLLVTNVLNREYIVFYEAGITTELLDVLRDPTHANTSVEWPTVRRIKLPYKPYDTFAARLTSILVASSPASLNNSFDLDGGDCFARNCRKRAHVPEDNQPATVRHISKRRATRR
ncbi:hypothetical protein P168DRAFT_307196 [Aspergillus campestris IBT 28561]|uniref:Uncharacterized protein n=1 Tax=Aspergillus campestris (strain IBT 28561) TaxID=1392248 RepID=A0A2I1CSY0_ASPC2|nr:uncharacterized protein P168DRAFT_307196 [Aspergillus campestris IBT 28561]PKY00728.1 hypothetical protein P168DRAFT_307196 [Aspergillus campestris IBT 28561]